jgi:probable rRNA maturation factor
MLERVLWGDDKPDLFDKGAVQNMVGDDKVPVVDRVKRAEVKSDVHDSIMISWASLFRRLKRYPATLIEIGSPIGATCSTTTSSPGMQPISISFSSSSELLKLAIRPRCPCFRSDRRIKELKAKAKSSVHPTLPEFCQMPVKKSSIRFHYTDQRFRFPDRTVLKAFLVQLAKKEGSAVEDINYIFCSDEYLLKINQEQLQHDNYTDIITFPYSGKGAPLVSDIFISVDRVRDNADEFGTAFLHELHRVIFHGILHLCGYKDKTKKDQAEMRSREEFWLNRYFRST